MTQTHLDQTIRKLKAGKEITWDFCHCKKDLLYLYGGERSFRWTFREFTYVRLMNPKQKLNV